MKTKEEDKSIQFLKKKQPTFTMWSDFSLMCWIENMEQFAAQECAPLQARIEEQNEKLEFWVKSWNLQESKLKAADSVNEQLRKRIEDLESVCETSINSLIWRQENEPEQWSNTDGDHLNELTQLLSKKK